MPVKIVAVFTPRPGCAGRLDALLRGMLGPSRAEAGNLRYDLWREPAGEGRFMLDELYADDAAVAAHRASTHFADYLARVETLADRLAVTAHGQDVTDAT